MAPAIVGMMKPHKAYIEPFAGSLAVLLSKPSCPIEVINDQHAMLIDFYRVLRDPELFSQLEDVIRLTAYSRAELDLAKEDSPDLDRVERVRRFFVRVNQAYVSSNGYGNFTVTTQSTSNHSNASKWVRFQERLWATRARLEGVQIECCDAMDLLTKLLKKDDPDAVVYLDPPYMAEVRNGSRYDHDLTSLEEHEALAELAGHLASTGRQLLISGYASPEYERLYKGWERHELNSTRSSRHGRGAVSQVEVVWVSPTKRKRPRPRVAASS